MFLNFNFFFQLLNGFLFRWFRLLLSYHFLFFLFHAAVILNGTTKLLWWAGESKKSG